MKKAILFDLDGTLWDSSLEVSLSWSIALARYGKQLSQADIKSVMGKTMTEIGTIFLPDHTAEQRHEILSACSETELQYLAKHGAAAYPHLSEVLQELSHDYALCIVSNCQEGYIETFLKCCDLSDRFLDTENAGRTGLSKGENIRLVLERNEFDAAVYVGDTQKDLDAALDAGIPFIHAAYGFGTVPSSYPAIRSLDQLPALVRTLL